MRLPAQLDENFVWDRIIPKRDAKSERESGCGTKTKTRARLASPLSECMRCPSVVESSGRKLPRVSLVFCLGTSAFCVSVLLRRTILRGWLSYDINAV